MHGHKGKLLDFILPPRCVLTGEIVDEQGMIAPSAWAELNFIAPPYCSHCGVPFGFDVDEGDETDEEDDGQTTCNDCLDNPPEYIKARAALIYDEASRNLILPFKHGDKTHYTKAFLPWLNNAGGQMIKGCDYMIPVPLHPLRLFQRRFNQAGLIAGALARHHKKPVLLGGLKRIKATEMQARLNAKARAKNVKRAFIVNSKHAEAIKGKKILLIDDVYTTGATIKECTKVLMKSGAAEVTVLTLACTFKNKI